MAKRPGLRFRLMLVNFAVVTALLVSAYFTQAHLARAESAAEDLSARSIQVIELAAQLETLMHEKSNVSNYLLSKDPQFIHQTQQHYEGVGRWIDGMGQFAATAQEHAIVDELRRGYIRYVQQGDEVITLDRAGKRKEALEAFFAMKREVEALLSNGQEVFNLEKSAMRASRQETTLAIARQRHIMFALIGLGSGLSVIMSALLATYAVRPIYRLVVRLGAASGDVSMEETHDELSVLETRVTSLLARVRAQERKLARTARLSQLGELAAELAHEILNPIAGVKAMLQTLQRTPAEPSKVTFELAAMERDIGRVEKTIRRLMRYARPFEPNLSLTPLADLIQSSLATVRRLPALSERQINVDVADDATAWLLDKDLISQVLVNLLVNACEASPSHEAVDLTVAVQTDLLRLRVRDRGEGLSAEAQSRLFHPFFTTKENGNGLGLAVSRNIVQEHGGLITGQAAPDGGSVFEVVLPRGGL